MTPDQIALIEEGGYALMRESSYKRGTELLALALELRYANLPPVFSCDVDESAGMAEVVELNGYSRKTPCL